jgi:hypothetical protein
VVVRDQVDADGLAALLAGGSSTVEQIALGRQRAAGVPQAETLSLLDHLFTQGLLDEEPSVPEPRQLKEVVNGKAETM